MNISAASWYPLNNLGINQNSGADAKITSLEQKLQKLTTERQRAVQHKDEEQKKKIEKQIQEIKQQIQQLRQHTQEKTEEAGNHKSSVQEISQNSSETRKYMDAYV